MRAFRLDVRRRGFLKSALFFLLAFFLLLFPKGGIKVGGVPITWGYLLLGILGVFFSLRKRFVILSSRLRCLLLLLPFQILSFLTLIINGVENFGFTIAFLISFQFLPLLFFLILSDSIEHLSLDTLLRFLRMGVLFLATYGIFLFFYRYIAGKWIEIPFLTINYHDMGALDDKNIGRGGGVFKLISTYNNGNIYGICMLMLLPLYNLCENSFVRKTLVKLSILLTLSRTVWLGLFFSELLYDFMIRRGSRWIKYKFLFVFAFFGSAIIYMTYQFDFDIAFLLDRTLGNRVDQLEYFITANLLSSDSFDGIVEIVYMGILKNFGWLGLITFLLGMTGPLWIKLLKDHRRRQSPFEKALSASLLIYLFISLADGAILFIPTMVFYWFIASLMQRREFHYCISARGTVSINPNSIKYSRFSLTN